MSKRAKLAIAAALLLLGVAVLGASEDVRFTLGGALVDVGYFVQDPIDEPEDITPSEVLSEVHAHNELAASLRQHFPRTHHHPLVAMVVCMDSRLDTNELLGDTRQYYYVLRTAGSLLSEREEEMLELAVAGGVKVILLTTHTDCAAERAAADPVQRARYPHLTAGVDRRAAHRAELLARPAIAARIQSGELIVEEARIDTHTGRLAVLSSLPRGYEEGHAHPP